MTYQKTYCAGACIGLILFSVNCFAESRIVVQPKIEVGFQNDSNFWKSEDDEVSVNTYYAKPGIVLGYETPRTQLALDTTLEPYWYDDQESRSAGVNDASDDNYVGFTGILSADYELSDRLSLGLQDQLYVTRDPADTDTNSDSVNRDKYTINYVEPSAYYELTDKFGLRTAYRNTNTNYNKNSLEDSNENRGIFDLYYNLNSVSAIYLDYQIWARDYDKDSSDYTSNQLTLNYERTFKYFSFLGGAGYQHRTFDDTLDDIDLFTWNFQVKRMDADSSIRTTRSRLLLEIGQDANNDGTGDEYFTATYVRFGGGYRFTDRVEVSSKAAYQNSNYDQSPQDDNTYLISGKLAYLPLDYLTLGIEGGYETRNSNINGNDYDNTFVLLTLSVSYNLGNR